ncbi:hypothetical protein HCC47_01870 [Streptococcus suis]|nr:hypothetical protein [Streptococcus suis]
MKRLILLILTFSIIYNPPLFGIYLADFCAIFSLVFLFLKTVTGNKVINKKIFFNLILPIFLILLYLLIVITFNYQSITNLGTHLNILFKLIPTAIVISILAKTSDGVVEILFISGIIQSFLAGFSYFFPQLQQFFISQLLLAGQSQIVSALSGHRMYGWAGNLTYSTPIVQIMILFLGLSSNKYKKLSLFLSPIFVFSSIINARTGIVVLLIGILCYSLINYKKIIGILFINLSILSMYFVLYQPSFILSLHSINPTINWIYAGMKEIVLFFYGQEVGYFGYVTSAQRTVLPDGISQIFGQGTRLMGNTTLNMAGTDIGYINDIWLGGYIYLICIFIIVILNLVRGYLLSENRNLMYTLFVFFTLIFVNVKGYIFSYNAVMNFLVILLISLYYFNPLTQSKKILND